MPPVYLMPDHLKIVEYITQVIMDTAGHKNVTKQLRVFYLLQLFNSSTQLVH